MDFSKAFSVVPHGRLLEKFPNSGVDHRVVIWIKEFLLGHTQRVRIGEVTSDEARITSGVPQGSVLGPLLLAYINECGKNTDSNIRLFANDCIIYRKIYTEVDMTKLQRDVNRLGEWSVENGMKVNPIKSKSISFTKARSNTMLNYYLLGTPIPETSNCKYLGIILCKDLSWADQVSYMVKKAWKALHFIMRILKKGTNNTKGLAYETVVQPFLEYGAACWDPYRKGQKRELDKVQRKAAKFAYHTNFPEWETLESRRKIAQIGALYKAFSGEQAWMGTGNRLK